MILFLVNGKLNISQQRALAAQRANHTILGVPQTQHCQPVGGRDCPALFCIILHASFGAAV